MSDEELRLECIKIAALLDPADDEAMLRTAEVVRRFVQDENKPISDQANRVAGLGSSRGCARSRPLEVVGVVSQEVNGKTYDINIVSL